MSSDPISSGDEDKLELFYLFNDEVSQDMSIALNLAAPTAFGGRELEYSWNQMA